MFVHKKRGDSFYNLSWKLQGSFYNSSTGSGEDKMKRGNMGAVQWDGKEKNPGKSGSCLGPLWKIYLGGQTFSCFSVTQIDLRQIHAACQKSKTFLPQGLLKQPSQLICRTCKAMRIYSSKRFINYLVQAWQGEVSYQQNNKSSDIQLFFN